MFGGRLKYLNFWRFSAPTFSHHTTSGGVAKVYPGYTPRACESQKQPKWVNVEVQNWHDFNLASMYLANSCDSVFKANACWFISIIWFFKSREIYFSLKWAFNKQNKLWKQRNIKGFLHRATTMILLFTTFLQSNRNQSHENISHHFKICRFNLDKVAQHNTT